MPVSESKIAPESDAELVHRAKGGDDSAFDELVVRYRKKVYAIAFGMARNHGDADDVAQETFLRAYQALNRFKTEFEFKTWLFRIAVNTCINMLKRKGRRVETSFEEKIEAGMPQPVTPGNPGKEMEQQELREKIDEAIQQLSPKLRSVFVLRTQQDLSYEEIARVLKISRGTVMSRLSRARDSMRHLLRDYVQNTIEESR
jgi:RNA polymerase sigma-70 factor (ECF subfamily)